MAKLTLLLVTFALFLFATNAAIYRTTVVVDDEENPDIQRECQQELQQQQMLQHCQRLLSQCIVEAGHGRRPTEEEEQQKEQKLRQCCRQLQQVRTPCRCPGLEQAARSQESKGRLSEVQKAVLYFAVEKISELCNLEPRKCDMPSSTYDV